MGAEVLPRPEILGKNIPTCKISPYFAFFLNRLYTELIEIGPIISADPKPFKKSAVLPKNFFVTLKMYVLQLCFERQLISTTISESWRLAEWRHKHSMYSSWRTCNMCAI